MIIKNYLYELGTLSEGELREGDWDCRLNKRRKN